MQGCLKLSSDFSGANIYVEQHRTLKLLHGGSSSNLLLRPDGKRHCFESHAGQVALFLESETPFGGSDPLRREMAAFDYDLQLEVDGQQDDQQSHDPWQGTRLVLPCHPYRFRLDDTCAHHVIDLLLLCGIILIHFSIVVCNRMPAVQRKGVVGNVLQ